jgi:putative transposase
MKTLRRYIEEGAVYFTTSLVSGKRKIFDNPEAAVRVIHEIYRLREKGAMHLLAFVVMPEHFHLLCQPLDKDISNIMRHVKRNSSFNLHRDLGIETPIWVKRFHDEVVDSEEGLRRNIEYIHFNPVKRGLAVNPEDYRFSSAYSQYEVDWEKVF